MAQSLPPLCQSIIQIRGDAKNGSLESISSLYLFSDMGSFSISIPTLSPSPMFPFSQWTHQIAINSTNGIFKPLFHQRCRNHQKTVFQLETRDQVKFAPFFELNSTISNLLKKKL